MGLVSDGGVHSGWEHIEALHRARRPARACPTSSCTRSPTAATRCRRPAPGYVAELERWLRQAGRIGTVSGRYYAMDRDRRWERTKLAYDAIVHAEGLRAASADGGDQRGLRARRDRRVHPPDRDRRLRRHGRRRRGRSTSTSAPTAPASWCGRSASPTSTSSTAASAPQVELTTLTEYRDGLGLPGRLPARGARDDAGRGARRARRAPAARRRDREVRPRHLLLQRRPRGRSGRGRSARLVDSPRDVPTYDHKPEMSAAAAADAFTERWAGRRLPVRDHQLRQPRHGRPHGRHPGGGDRDRGGRRAASARWSRRSTRRAAPASSPPTTATPTTCSSPTARRTRPTRSTRCPLIVTVGGHRARRRRALADVAPDGARAARDRAAGRR